MHARHEPDEIRVSHGTDLLIKRPLSQYERSLFLYGSFLLLPVRNSSLAFSENVEPARAWHRRLGGPAIRYELHIS
jgi:hypothetical protein